MKTMILHSDAKDAHWDRNPEAYRIDTITLDRSTILDLYLAPGGGFAIEIIEL